MNFLNCTRCLESKDEDSFHRNKNMPHRYFRGHVCKSCTSLERKVGLKTKVCDREGCNQELKGDGRRKYCGVICSNMINKNNNLKYKKKYENNLPIKTSMKRKLTDKVLRSKPNNLYKRYNDDEIESIMKKKNGRYVFSSDKLAIELGRTLSSINNFRARNIKKHKVDK